jgi:hypothetical protein
LLWSLMGLGLARLFVKHVSLSFLEDEGCATMTMKGVRVAVGTDAHQRSALSTAPSW